MKVDPYLNFNGRADEAVEFYKSALGAKVNMIMRFKESPVQCPDVPSPPKYSTRSCTEKSPSAAPS